MSGTSASRSTTQGPGAQHAYDPSATTAQPPGVPTGWLPGVTIVREAGEEGLTAEFLIAMAERRMSAIDGQIKLAVGAMNQRSENLEHLRVASQIIDQFRTQHECHNDDRIDLDASVTVQNTDGTTRVTSLAKELQDAGMDPAAYRVASAGNQGPKLSELEPLSTAVRNQVERFQQSAELDQVRLQQLVSSRGTLVQTASQIMAAMHETEKNITGNIRG